jgi:transcriptional regulator with XRE-family HTH domain
MKNIGEKLRRLRIQRNLTQEELANRCELSKGFISQVERDLTSPSIATLVDILECLGSDLKEFFSSASADKVVFKADDVFEKENDGGSVVVRWLIANAQKNMMEPIEVIIAPSAKTELDNPHEGEEFGYIIKGEIVLHVGRAEYRAAKGESFYFRPSAEHYIENRSKKAAELLWVAAPPSF